MQGEAANGMPVRVVVTESAALEAARDAATSAAGWVGRSWDVGPPELREQMLGDRLARQDVPGDMLSFGDLIGDLQSHSKWSDGKGSILEMARASRGRGDRYLAVTDPASRYDGRRARRGPPGGAGAGDPHRERGAPPEARDECVGDYHRAAGQRGGGARRRQLDLPDDVLAGLDWVVVSIHVSQRQSAKEVTARMEGVLANPYVDCIGHPTSRLLLRCPRTNLDVDRLIELAAELGDVLAINASPRRLDLGADHARQALEAGVRLAINTDTHRPTTLGMRRHGISVARRAGARRPQVVNCLPWPELEASRRRHLQT